MDFDPGTFPSSNFRLYRSELLSGAWLVDGGALLDTNGATGKPRFTTTMGTNAQGYFRVGTP